MFAHAPLAVDPDRPMHVVHADAITVRMRIGEFNWRRDLEADFPSRLWPLHVYPRQTEGLARGRANLVYAVRIWRPLNPDASAHRDYDDVLQPHDSIGKIDPTSVEFRDYEWTMGSFRLSHALCVLRGRPELKALAVGEAVRAG